LNGIIGMSDLLSSSRSESELNEGIEVIRRCSTALLEIVNDILDFSKIEAGSMQLEHVPFSPEVMVESAIDIITPAATAKGLQLTYVIKPDVPFQLIGDVTRLRQIMINFLSNAVKFTEVGYLIQNKYQ
jgi:signal transduction histidine kinase